MNILITGYPGTGKTLIAQELKARGHSAYDPQSMRSYMHTELKTSGKRIAPPHPAPKGWYGSIGSYNWDHIKIMSLLEQPQDTFICSLAGNQQSYYDSFNIVFILTLSDLTLEHRLRNRDKSALGHSKDELKDILTNRAHFEQALLNQGAIKLNAEMTPSLIIDEIISHIATYPSGVK